MLSFFMILMTVSSAPLDLVNKKQASNHVTELMSHPRFSQALLQNETFLSELAEADPETLNTILGLLEGLLDASEAASVAFTTDVTDALAVKDAKSSDLVDAVRTHDGAVIDVNAANVALTEARSDEVQAAGAVTDATTDFDAADDHHTAMVNERDDKQPVLDAESATLRDTIALVQTLLPEAGRSCSYGTVVNNKRSGGGIVPPFADGLGWSSPHRFEEANNLCAADSDCTGLMWYNNEGGSYTTGGQYQISHGTQLSSNNDWDWIPATCTEADCVWSSAKVVADERCTVELWHGITDRGAAELKCQSDSECFGLHWYNNDGGDGRTDSTGKYQGCGSMELFSNPDWDTIYKPRGCF